MLVVTGASGHLGRATLSHLLAKLDGSSQVILATRDPAALADLAPGPLIRHADFAKPSGLRDAFAGGTRLLLISATDIAVRARQHADAIDAARAAGVRQVIYTSMVSPGPDNPALISESHWATEEHLRASGLAWTILRCGLYADFQVFDAATALASGRLLHNQGSGRCAYLPREDIARSAAAVLAEDSHEGATYELTGPAALSAADLAALYGSVGGGPVEAVPVSDGELMRSLAGDASDEGHVQYGAALTVSLGQAVRGGQFDRVTSSVQDLTGTAPGSVENILRWSEHSLRQAALGA